MKGLDGNKSHDKRSKRHLVLKFVVVFGALALVVEELSFTDVFNSWVVSSFTTTMAKLSFFLLKALGQPAALSGNIIHSMAFSLEVTNDCSGVAPVWLFAAAVIAFPATWRRKIPAILLGTLLLLAVNVARIVSLYFVRLHQPAWFETVHLEVWPAIFILAAVCAWWRWLQWLNRCSQLEHNV